MDDLAGHAAPPPLRREVLVAAPVATAFAVFTGHIGAWWPLERFSVFGAAASVAFEDGAIVERLGTQSSEWGRVSIWEPPHRISFTWHPGRGNEHAMTVTVTFDERDAATLVTLVHEDWHRHPFPEEGRREYETGWTHVLGRFVEWVDGGQSEAAQSETAQFETAQSETAQTA